MEYENRLNRSSPERCYRIEGNCLKWEDINGNSDVIPFEKVASIQLQYAPLRGLENYYIFTLKTIDGRTIQFSNQHLVKKIGIVLSFIPLFYKYIKRGKPVLYDPLSIPEKLLPPED